MYQVTSRGAPKSQSHICPANLRSPLRAESWDIWRWSLESLEVWWSFLGGGVADVADVADVAVYSKGTLWDSSHSCCFVGFSFWFSLDAYPHLLTKNMSMYTYDRWKPSPVSMFRPSGRSKTFCSRAISLNSIDLSKQARWRAKHWLASRRRAPLLVQVLVNHATSKSKQATTLYATILAWHSPICFNLRDCWQKQTAKCSSNLKSDATDSSITISRQTQRQDDTTSETSGISSHVAIAFGRAAEE